MRRYGSVLALGLVLVTTPVAAQQHPTVVKTPKGVLLDFQQADVRAVIAALADAGQLNVIFGEIPSRKVTLRMSQPVPSDKIPGLLKSVAQANGLRLEKEGALIRVESATPAPPARAPAAEHPQTPSSSSGLRLFVYRLRHVKAARLAQTLSTLFGRGGTAQTTSHGPNHASSTGIPASIPPYQPPKESAQPPKVDVSVGQAQPPSLPGEVTGAVQIVPDEVTNSLLVRSTESDYNVIRSAIAALDVRPLQVLIEVLIIEVTRNSSNEVGISAGSIDSLSQPISKRVKASLVGSTSGDLQLTVRHLGNLNVDAALSLLSESGNVRVLSRPVVLAQNNQEAHILVGSEQPFIQVSRALPTENATRDQIVQYRDVGTSLTITPTINLDGYVSLDLRQEVSTATTQVQFGAPVINTREANTRLFVRDGQSVVIGGLISDTHERTRSGIPLLKDIPVLGYLFGSSTDHHVQSELYLFLTPHLIATDQDADSLRKQIEGGTTLIHKIPPVLIPSHISQDTTPRDTTRPSPAPNSATPDTTPRIIPRDSTAHDMLPRVAPTRRTPPPTAPRIIRADTVPLDTKPTSRSTP